MVLGVDENAGLAVHNCVERTRHPSRNDRKPEPPCLHEHNAEPLPAAERIQPAQHREHRGSPHDLVARLVGNAPVKGDRVGHAQAAGE